MRVDENYLEQEDLDSLFFDINEIEIHEDALTDTNCKNAYSSEFNLEYIQGEPSDENEFGEFNQNNDNETDDNTTNINLRRKRAFIASSLILTLIISSIFGVKTYREIKAEEARLSELKKDDLDLKLLISTVDDLGGTKYQLNWKEIASVLGVLSDNMPNTITEKDIEDVSALFLNNNEDKINNLDEVVKNLEIKKKEKERIYDYLEDLSEYGYTPDKLTHDSEQMKFINSIKPGAFDSYKKTGILPSITIAQAILESNWGESNLYKEANNLFGIKADSSWNGEVVTFETKEFHDTYINDKFRKYETLTDSIIDHSEFLKANQRYTEGGVFEAKTYKAQALALQESGYSTAQDEDGNKTYASMLEVLIRQYNLQLYDWEIVNC